MAEAPRRTLKVASVVGRVFEAPTLPGAYPELGDARAGHRAARRAADGRPRDPRPRGGPGLPVQARRDPGGRLREPAVRRALDAPRADRPVPRGQPTRRRLDQQRRPARPPLLAERRRDPQAAVPRRGGGRGAGVVRERGGDRLPGAAAAAARRGASGSSGRSGSPRSCTSSARSRGPRRSSSRPAREAEALGDPRLVARCDHSLAESARRVGRFDEAAALLGAGAGRRSPRPATGPVRPTCCRSPAPWPRSAGTRDGAGAVPGGPGDPRGARRRGRGGGADEQPRHRRAAAG